MIGGQIEVPCGRAGRYRVRQHPNWPDPFWFGVPGAVNLTPAHMPDGTVAAPNGQNTIPNLHRLDGQVATCRADHRPAPEAGHGGVTAVSAGNRHVLALTSTGGVKAWGGNQSGELGDGTTTDRWTPVDVPGLSTGVTKVVATNYFSLVLTASGGAKAWGYGGFGNLGNGTNSASCPVPVDVQGLTAGVVDLAGGYYSGHAITAAGAYKAWGFNMYGTLGTGNTTSVNTPTDMVGF